MLLRFLIRLFGCLAVFICQAGHANVVAQRSIFVQEPLIFAQAERIDIGADGVFSKSVTTQLPESWNGLGKSGQSRYLLAFDISNPTAASPLAMYVPRLGNRFTVLVNGKKIAESAP
jgi:hypothetical protein